MAPLRETPSFIQPLSITFPLRGQDLVVTAATVGQLAAMLALLTPLLGRLVALPGDLLARLEAGAPSVADVVQLTELVSEDLDLLLQVCQVATGLTMEQLRALNFDEAAMVFATAVHVNADFFARARPTLRAAVGKLMAIKAPAQPESQPTKSRPSTKRGPNASTS